MKLVLTCKFVTEPDEANIPVVFEAYRKRFMHLAASGVLGQVDLRFLIQTGNIVVPVAADEEVSSNEPDPTSEPTGTVS